MLGLGCALIGSGDGRPSELPALGSSGSCSEWCRRYGSGLSGPVAAKVACVGDAEDEEEHDDDDDAQLGEGGEGGESRSSCCCWCCASLIQVPKYR